MAIQSTVRSVEIVADGIVIHMESKDTATNETVRFSRKFDDKTQTADQIKTAIQQLSILYWNVRAVVK